VHRAGLEETLRFQFRSHGGEILGEGFFAVESALLHYFRRSSAGFEPLQHQLRFLRASVELHEGLSSVTTVSQKFNYRATYENEGTRVRASDP